MLLELCFTKTIRAKPGKFHVFSSLNFGKICAAVITFCSMRAYGQWFSAFWAFEFFFAFSQPFFDFASLDPFEVRSQINSILQVVFC